MAEADAVAEDADAQEVQQVGGTAGLRHSAAVATFVSGLSEREQDGWTPLHAAASRGDSDAVAALLTAGAAVNAVALPVLLRDAQISVEAAETRYGRERWARLTTERDQLDAARDRAGDAHKVAVTRLEDARREVEEAEQALRQAFDEKKTALEQAKSSAEGVLGRAEAGGLTGAGAEIAKTSREEKKQKYMAHADYQEASAAEKDLEDVSKKLLVALARLSAQELREHLEQMSTVDPEAGVHRSEGIWSFQFHQKRQDLDTLSGQARIAGVDEDAITAVPGIITGEPVDVAALVSLICRQVADEAPAKPHERAERLQDKVALQSDLDLARKRAKSCRERAEQMGRQFLSADSAYERARGMGEQQQRQVQVLQNELARLKLLQLEHDQDQAAFREESLVVKSEFSESTESPVISDAEQRRNVNSLHKLMGEFAYSEEQAAAALAAAGSDLQMAAQAWLVATADVAWSFSETQKQQHRQHRQQLKRSESMLEGKIQSEPDKPPKPPDYGKWKTAWSEKYAQWYWWHSDTTETTWDDPIETPAKAQPEQVPEPEREPAPAVEPDVDAEMSRRKRGYTGQGLLDLIITSRSKGLYPPQAMDLGYPAAPTKPASSAPRWMNGPSARQQVAMNRLWRQTWDKAVGASEPVPPPQGVSTRLWSKDLPQEERHDLMRNLFIGILQVRYGYEKVKPDVVRGDFLERSVFVAQDEIVRGIKRIDSAILDIKDPHLRAKKCEEAEAKEAIEARKSFESDVNDLFREHDPEMSMKPHSIPLTPNFRLGGIAAYRHVIGLVTFKDKQTKVEALKTAAEKKQNKGDQTIPRLSTEVMDSTDIALLTQLCEAELRRNLQEADESFMKAQPEHSKISEDANESFFANYKIAAARERVQAAAVTLRHREREHQHTADQLKKTQNKKPVYNARWTEEAAAAKMAEVEDTATKMAEEEAGEAGEAALARAADSQSDGDTGTEVKKSHRWQVFVNDETILRASDAKRPDSEIQAAAFPLGPTALHFAAMQGHIDVCRQLLENKADPNVRDSTNGFTVLDHAARIEADLASRCAAAKDSVNVSESTLEDLSGSCSPDIDRVRAKYVIELRQLRSTLIQLEGKRHAAARLSALLRGQDNIVVALKTASAGESNSTRTGTDTDRQSLGSAEVKIASLQAAAARGDFSFIRSKLCLAPETLNAQDPRGFTLLHWAARNGAVDVVELLIGRGVDVNLRNNTGQTALHCAKDEAVATALLNAGAHHLVLDHQGRTAAQALSACGEESAEDTDASVTQSDPNAAVANVGPEVSDKGETDVKIGSGKGIKKEEQERQEKRKRRIAECQRTLNMAQDAALQRRAKKLANLVDISTTTAAGHRAAVTAERLLKTRASGRIQRARNAAKDTAATKQHQQRQRHQHPHDVSRADALVRRAREKMSAKSFDGAVALLDEALRLQPADDKINVLRDTAAQEALTLKMERLLHLSHFREAAKTARAVLLGDPLDSKAKQWLQVAVDGLWTEAKAVGSKLDKREKLKQITKYKLERQQRFNRLDPVGTTVEGPHSNIDRNYAALLDRQFKEVSHTCEVLHRESDRAHVALRSAMAPTPSSGNDSGEEFPNISEILNVVMQRLIQERDEAKQALDDADAAIIFNDSDEAKTTVKHAMELKRKACEALCNAAGELAPLGAAQRKPEDYKQELESAYARASKDVVDATVATEERKKIAEIDRDIARRRFTRAEKLTRESRLTRSGIQQSSIPEEEIRRRWTGHADEVVLMHFFKVQREAAKGELNAVEKLIHHCRMKWKGQDWRRKMYQQVASRYGVDPRVLWLEHSDAQKYRSRKPLPRRQERVPAAIESFVVGRQQQVAAETATIQRLLECREARADEAKRAEERYDVAVQAATTARVAFESDQISRAERRYVDDNVASALTALTGARNREAEATKYLQQARAAKPIQS